MLEEILRVCTAQGYKTDTAGIVSGLTEGIAFRADLPADTLQLSVNVPPEKLPRLHKQLASRYADIQLSPNEGYGILLTLPGMADMDGNAFIAFLQEAAQRSLGELHGAFDDHFEKDRESFSHYLTGILGALLGAVVGVLPWFIAAQLAVRLAGLSGEYRILFRLPVSPWRTQYIVRHHLHCNRVAAGNVRLLPAEFRHRADECQSGDDAAGSHALLPGQRHPGTAAGYAVRHSVRRDRSGWHPQQGAVLYP